MDRRDSNKEVVLGLFRAALRGDVPTALRPVADDYVEHSALIAPGKAGLAEFLRALAAAEPPPAIEVRHALADGDHVAVHYESTAAADGSGSEAVDIFRLRDGRIVEHWDVVQPRPARRDEREG